MRRGRRIVPGSVLGVYKILELVGEMNTSRNKVGVYKVECLSCGGISVRESTLLRANSRYCKHCSPYASRYYVTPEQKEARNSKLRDTLERSIELEDSLGNRFLTQPCPPSVLENRHSSGRKEV